MLIRSALLAGALTMFGALPALADTPDATRCEATTFRVYFSHGSSAMDEMAMQTLAAAERQMAACSYAELRVSVDASSSRAGARAEAIRAAADGRAWDAVRVTPRALAQRASFGAGPEYAEVTMSPHVMPAHEAPATQHPNT